MNDIDRSIKHRATIQRQFWLILGVLVVLMLLSGWWAYQVHVVPEFEEERQVIDAWDESTHFDHQSTILQDTLPWDAGDVVTNRPIYYVNVSEDLDGSYQYVYTADEGSLSVTTDVALIIRAVDGDAIFWEVAEPLAATAENELQPDEAHEVTFSVDIVHVLEVIETVERQLDAREGLVDVRVQVFTHVEGEADGTALNVTHQSDMPMVVNPQTFRVLDLETIDVPHEDTEIVETLVEPTPIERWGSIGAFLLLVILLIGHLTGRATGLYEISQEERELLQLAEDREEFDDWITVGTFPTERDYASTILVDSLMGLVDVAIDTNNRVIEDPQLGVSVVLDDEYVYLYVRPDSPARDWLVNYADFTIDEFEQS